MQCSACMHMARTWLTLSQGDRQSKAAKLLKQRAKLESKRQVEAYTDWIDAGLADTLPSNIQRYNRSDV